jgi:hypothetical protein
MEFEKAHSNSEPARKGTGTGTREEDIVGGTDQTLPRLSPQQDIFLWRPDASLNSQVPHTDPIMVARMLRALSLHPKSLGASAANFLAYTRSFNNGNEDDANEEDHSIEYEDSSNQEQNQSQHQQSSLSTRLSSLAKSVASRFGFHDALHAALSPSHRVVDASLVLSLVDGPVPPTDPTHFSPFTSVQQADRLAEANQMPLIRPGTHGKVVCVVVGGGVSKHTSFLCCPLP